MDELTLLRSTRDDSREPSVEALAAGRAALLGRITGDRAMFTPANHNTTRRWVPRLTWTAAAVATATTGVIVIGNVTLSAQSAFASDVLHSAATEAINYADLVVGSDQYLRSLTHARWDMCDASACKPNDQVIDVYMPADTAAEWVLYRDWGGDVSRCPRRLDRDDASARRTVL